MEAASRVARGDVKRARLGGLQGAGPVKNQASVLGYAKEDGVRTTFASESVTEGHPDKVCDKISDSVLDAALTLDPKARVACETLVSENLTVITGEVSEVVLE